MRCCIHICNTSKKHLAQPRPQHTMRESTSHPQTPASMSRPSTSACSERHSVHSHHYGLKASPHQTLHKLGYVSPSYLGIGERPGTVDCHGILGSVGYLSSAARDIAPARFGLGSAGSLRGSGPRRLTQHDREFLEQHDAKTKSVFEQWAKTKDAQAAAQRKSIQRCACKRPRMHTQMHQAIWVWLPCF